MEAIDVAAVGITIAVVVSVGVDTVDVTGSAEDTFAFNFYGIGSDLATLLTQLVVPWIWIAVFAGLGALMSGRVSLLLGLPKR